MENIVLRRKRYLEKKIFAQKMRCKAEKERGGIFREDFFAEEKKTEKEKEENILSNFCSLLRQLPTLS